MVPLHGYGDLIRVLAKAVALFDTQDMERGTPSELVMTVNSASARLARRG